MYFVYAYVLSGIALLETVVIVIPHEQLVTRGGSVAQWVGRWLVIERSRVRLPASPLPSNNSGQVVHTHVPLSLSSIIWYRPKGGDALQPGR